MGAAARAAGAAAACVPARGRLGRKSSTPYMSPGRCRVQLKVEALADWWPSGTIPSEDPHAAA